jgi:hypothetical protein
LQEDTAGMGYPVGFFMTKGDKIYLIETGVPRDSRLISESQNR